MTPSRWLLVWAVVAFGAFQWWQGRPVATAAGVLVPADPLQAPVAEASAFRRGDYTVHPLASFAAEARVLSRERYWLGREAALAPVDLLLGWGPLSDSSVLERLSFSQSNRFGYWSARELPVAERTIVTHSANMHLIPADGEVERRIKDTRPGEVVSLRGYLVRVEAADGWRWQSSLSREDSGAGACELVWVESFRILPAGRDAGG